MGVGGKNDIGRRYVAETVVSSYRFYVYSQYPVMTQFNCRIYMAKQIQIRNV